MTHFATVLRSGPARVRGMLCCLAGWLAAAWCLLLPLAVQAQSYSYDGNRWYEIELIVFRHLGGASAVTERPAAELPATSAEGVSPPAYPMLELASPLSDFLLDFDAMLASSMERETGQPESYGPRIPRGGTGSFRLTDFARDPWIALDNRYSKLGRDLQRLQDSGSHELLWHAVWRQPMLGAAQAPGVMIPGGDEPAGEEPGGEEPGGEERGGEEEMGEALEGSVRFTAFNESTLRASLDLSFTPFQQAATSVFGAPSALPVWKLEEQRDILVNTYHYFDNPAFGVLLQVRPYELPALSATSSAADF